MEKKNINVNRKKRWKFDNLKISAEKFQKLKIFPKLLLIIFRENADCLQICDIEFKQNNNNNIDFVYPEN